MALVVHSETALRFGEGVNWDIVDICARENVSEVLEQ